MGGSGAAGIEVYDMKQGFTNDIYEKATTPSESLGRQGSVSVRLIKKNARPSRASSL